jgi:uncharacterized membrane protein
MRFLQKFKSIQSTVVLLAFIFGLTLIILIPPFQSPDEDMHYLSAAAISGGHFFCNNGNLLVNTRYLNLVNQMDVKRIAFNPSQKFNPKILFNYNEVNPGGINKNVNVASIFCYQNQMGHIIPATAIKFADILGLNTLAGFYMARLFSLLAALLIIFYAIKVIPFGKNVIAVTVLLPMTINQISSVTYDALLIPLTMLFTALVLYLSVNKETFSKNYFK